MKDEMGTPLSGDAVVRLVGPSGPVLTGPVDPSIGVGVNYSLKVPMDAGTQGELYQSTALFPAMPYVMNVVIDGISYVPIEIQREQKVIGDTGGRTRLDLTLGVDNDGDGLPDSWEEVIIAATDAESLADVRADGDNDGDGVSNYIEYIAGTYAYSELAVFRLDIIQVVDGVAHMRFLASSGRTYEIRSMSGGGEWEATDFSFGKEAVEMTDSYVSDSLRFVDVYIRAEEIASRLFQLHVH
ncbi:MAG: hypothetical protein P8J87_14770 [Verrucomicrobiales bacterium]|nr:hypothetical protein [Verrucomicrobiales bacterium]